MNQRRLGMMVVLTASAAGLLWSCSGPESSVSPDPPVQTTPSDPARPPAPPPTDPAPPTDTPPAMPSGLKATQSKDGIALDWADNTESDLAGYQVSRLDSATGQYTLLTKDLLTKSEYTDTTAPVSMTSYYHVVAVDKGNNASSSASVSATRSAITPNDAFKYARIADQPDGVSEAQGLALNGKLYTFGGFDNRKNCCTPTDRAYVYDPATNKWTALTPMPNHGATHAGITTDGKDIFYAGGYIADKSWTEQIFGTKAVWRYNVAANTYDPLPDLPIERAAGQLEYLDGKLHYFGGTNLARTQDVGDHYVLDLANGAKSWTTAKSPLPNPRHHMGSAVLNGKIYAIGGQHAHDEKLTTQASVNAYDPVTDTWTAPTVLKDLPSARSHIANSTFVLNGRIVTAGGETAHNVAIDDVSAYDPATDSWSELTPLPVARVSGVAAAIGDGFVFTGGNSSAQGWRATP